MGICPTWKQSTSGNSYQTGFSPLLKSIGSVMKDQTGETSLKSLFTGTEVVPAVTVTDSTVMFRLCLRLCARWQNPGLNQRFIFPTFNERSRRKAPPHHGNPWPFSLFFSSNIFSSNHIYYLYYRIDFSIKRNIITPRALFNQNSLHFGENV